MLWGVRSSEGWLPNLARGVSVWKLVDDLNDEALFDGRLLEPETEGPDNLPTAVLWDVEGLLPLAEAKRAHPEALRRAIMDFHICIERSRPFFEPGQSFDDYRDAFTLPTLRTDEGRHYFYDPDGGKLHAMNWGASRRHGAPGATLVLRKLSFRVFTGDRPPPPPSEPRPSASAEEPAAAAAMSDEGRRGRWLAAAALLALGAIVAAWLSLGGPSPSPPSRPSPSVATSVSAATPPPPVVTVAPAPTPTTSSRVPAFVPDRIYFAVGTAVLNAEAQSAVARLAAHLRTTSGAVLVEGHTDPTGAETENATLSARRSLAVIGALRAEGIATELTGVGCAARYPTSADPNRRAPATRRRVEIYLEATTTRPGCFTVGAR